MKQPKFSSKTQFIHLSRHSFSSKQNKTKQTRTDKTKQNKTKQTPKQKKTHIPRTKRNKQKLSSQTKFIRIYHATDSFCSKTKTKQSKTKQNKTKQRKKPRPEQLTKPTKSCQVRPNSFRVDHAVLSPRNKTQNQKVNHAPPQQIPPIQRDRESLIAWRRSDENEQGFPVLKKRQIRQKQQELYKLQATSYKPQVASSSSSNSRCNPTLAVRIPIENAVNDNAVCELGARPSPCLVARI